MKHILKKIVAPLCLYLGRLYFALSRSYFVWFYFLNRESRKLFKIDIRAHSLNKIQIRIVNDLKKHGISVIHSDEFFPDTWQLALFNQYAKELIKSNWGSDKLSKPFLSYLWDTVPVIDLGNPFVGLALDDRILFVVNSYMNMYSKFFFFTLNITRPVEKGATPIASQKWHRDPEDRKICKVFLYLNDVDEGSGPFEYILGSQEGRKLHKLVPSDPLVGRYATDDIIKRATQKSDIKVCTGRAGTLIFCDTSGLHRGGYAILGERIMFTTGYRSAASPQKSSIKYPENFWSDRRLYDLSPAVRYALKPNFTPFSSFVLKEYRRGFYLMK